MSDSSYSKCASKENLLDDYPEEEELDINKHVSNRQKLFLHKWSVAITVTAFSLLLALTISLFLQNRILQKNQYQGRFRFSNLPYDTPVVYHSHTEWWGENQIRADELWEGLDVSPLAVALTDDWAAEHKLQVSESRFPWDNEKGLYYLKSFHGLHCLKIMRKTRIDVERGNSPIIATEHFHHCLDALRQDILCTSDDTPMPTKLEKDVIGNNQVLMCRNWDKLIEWTQEPERQSCYRRLTNYRPLAHKLERFAFCPKDSKYFPVVEKYFKKWGHKDLVVA